MLWIAWIGSYWLHLGMKSRIHQTSGQANLNPYINPEHVVVIILEPRYQSQPSPTIHHSNNETWEGSSCYEILKPTQSYSILVWNVGAFYWNWHHPLVKSQGVMMVIHDGFKSQHCSTIHYTYNETLEGLGCCGLPESVHIHFILV